MREITVQDLAQWLQSGQPVHLLDVRQGWEHEKAALPGSQLIPLDQLVARADEIQPPASVPLIVYCHHGMRSLRAAAWLSQRGLPEVYSLAGGIDAWSLEIDNSVPRY
jgi:rhodanese-related sulfurtransferase